MSIDLAAIRRGLAANIQTVDSRLRVIPYYSDTLHVGVEGALEIGPRPGMGQTITTRINHGIFWYHLLATIYLTAIDEKAAQERMDAYLSVGGARSIWTAIESDGTAGGTVGMLVVDEQQGYGLIQRTNDRLLIASWVIRVKAA